jgi:RNA polymerase sporulation-specific sigma factor
MIGKVEICGVNTAELKVLSADECRSLLIRAKNGDTEARDNLIEGNLRLVLSVIQRFTSRGENMDDLFQVGCIGLIKAIQNFDTSLDVRFSTYGVPMIAGEIRRYLRDNSPLRVPRSTRDTAFRILQEKEALTANLGREPTIEEIANTLQIQREEVVFALDAISDPVSLYEPIYTDGGENLCVMDQLGDAKNTDEKWLERISLRSAISTLGIREKRILALRFYEGRTQAEVAKEIGISQAQVSRLEKSAIHKIKKEIAS